MATKFRNKAVIEAIQWTGDNFGEMGSFHQDIYGPYGKENAHLEIKTITGRYNVLVGDWIVKDQDGFIYTISNSFFSENFEPIPEDTPHTFEEDFHYFLTYSGLTHEKPGHRDLMRRAFEAGRNPREMNNGKIR